MGHMLNTRNGKHAFAYLGDPGWHHLGQNVNGIVNAHDYMGILRAAEMADWMLRLEPMYLANGQMVPDKRAMVRGDKGIALAVVGDKYRIVTNEDAFGVVEPLLAAGAATVETAGALYDGQRAFMLCRLPGEHEVIPGDKVLPYFLVQTGHDGTLGTEGFATPIRVVCHNTLTAAQSAQRGKSATFKVKHLSSAAQKLDEAKRLLAEMAESYQRTLRQYADMSRRPMTETESADYFAKVLPSRMVADSASAPVANSPAVVVGEVTMDSLMARPFASNPALDGGLVVVGSLSGETERQKSDRAAEAREIMLTLMARGAGSQLAGNTLWGAYNAVTEYADHVQTARKDGAERKGGYLAALLGTGADLKARAMEVAQTILG